MKKKGTWIAAILWIVFLILVAGIACFSFQNGEISKQMGEGLILKISQLVYPDRSLGDEELLQFTYVFRQSARVLAFLMIGLLGTITIHVTCKHSSWFIKTLLAAGILFMIAYATEALKKYIPTRHYSREEMMLSIFAAAVGFVIVSVVSLLRAGAKRLHQLVHVQNSMS